MKIPFIFFAVLMITACQPKFDAVRKVDKAHRSAPPGTVWIRDSLYMDRHEVSNLDYLEYVQWLKKNDSLNYRKALPDTTVWRDVLAYSEPFENCYFWHPAYRNYPVVGVSYEQAVAFCKWRTQMVLKLDGARKNSCFTKVIQYRLPAKKEWEYAAYGGTSLAYGYSKMQAVDNSPNFNVKETALLGYEEGGYVTDPVLLHKPNRFGIYNMIGNTAEMVMEKGICKGGSWFHSIADAEVRDSISYSGPKAWLGFRCVCVVKE
jgi:formylglycine-generating enzyme required for sulfatase activity